MKEKVLQYIKSNPGCSAGQIAAALSISVDDAHRATFLLYNEGRITKWAVPGDGARFRAM